MSGHYFDVSETEFAQQPDVVHDIDTESLEQMLENEINSIPASNPSLNHTKIPNFMIGGGIGNMKVELVGNVLKVSGFETKNMTGGGKSSNSASYSKDQLREHIEMLHTTRHSQQGGGLSDSEEWGQDLPDTVSDTSVDDEMMQAFLEN
jgi:hypothetical protein